MKQDLYNVHIDKQGFLCKDKKHPRLMYIDMRLPINLKNNLWAKNFKKAFKLLDIENEYNILILLKADDCTIDEKSIIVQNMKKIVIIDK